MTAVKQKKMEVLSPTMFTFTEEEMNVNTMLMADDIETSEKLLTDEFLVNLVGEMSESRDLLTIDSNPLKVAATEDFSDLISFDIEGQNFATLAPAEVQGSWLVSPPTPTRSEMTESLYSPMPSSVSSATSPGYESIDSSYSPMSSPSSLEENITKVVSPADVFGEQAPPKRKRGRKPKSEKGNYAPPKPKARKRKIYEIDEPLEDKEQERKRLNAVNAKRHRDLQKQAKEVLSEQLETVKVERDSLKREVEALRMKEVELSQQLEVFKKHFGNQAASIATLLSTGHVSF